MEAKPPWKKGDQPAASSASESVAAPPASKMRRRYQELESLVETQLAKMADTQRQQDSKIAQLEEEMHSVRQFCCTLTSQPEPKRRPQQSGLLQQSEQGQSTRDLQAVAPAMSVQHLCPWHHLQRARRQARRRQFR